MKKLFQFFLCLFFLVPSFAQAAYRDVFLHQGFMVDKDDNPLQDTKNMTFRLYEVPTGGEALWQQSQEISFKDGVYTAELGETEAFPENFFQYGNLYLGIQMEGDSEMSPRLILSSVPWAQWAKVAQSLSEDASLSHIAIKDFGEVIDKNGNWVGPAIAGSKGDKGDTGPQGATGAIGPVGLQGPKGDSGATGAQGLQGLQGLKGDKGDKGATGAQGSMGIAGPQGPVGATGAQGPAGANGLNAMTLIVKAADQSSSLTNYLDISDLSFPVAANTNYRFRAILYHTTLATTVGIRFAVNGPASPVGLRASILEPTSIFTVSPGTVTSYDTDFVATTSGPGSTAEMAIIEGIFRNGSNAGTFTLRFDSEIALSSVTVLKDSFLEYVTF